MIIYLYIAIDFFKILSYLTVMNKNGEYEPLYSQVETKIEEFLSMWLKIP